MRVFIREIVEKYGGVPYRLGGRDDSGLDCLGLVHLFYKDCGIDIPDGDGQPYTDSWVREDPDRYWRGLRQFGTEVSPDQTQELDLVYFRIGRYVSHSGIMVDMHHFVHILQNTVVKITPLSRSWRRRLVGVRRPENTMHSDEK